MEYMSTITENFEQSQLSLASYAIDLLRGMDGKNEIYILRLKEAGMTELQAQEFANTYSVVDQFTDPVKKKRGQIYFLAQ